MSECSVLGFTPYWNLTVIDHVWTYNYDHLCICEVKYNIHINVDVKSATQRKIEMTKMKFISQI